MSLKLKILGMGLLAVLATSAFAVMNASAEFAGQFHSEVSHTTIKGIEEGTHQIHLRRAGAALNEYIGCEEDEFTATTTAATVESITVIPHYRKCFTTNDPKTPVTVHATECDYTFTVTATTAPADPHILVHLTCAAGKQIEITHPNCTIRIPPQTVNAGTYTNKVDANGKHYVTLDVNATFTSTYHGLCQFIVPTNSTGELVGSATVRGFDTEGNQVSVTAT